MKFFISILTFSLIFLVFVSPPAIAQSLLSNVGCNFGANVPMSNSQFYSAYASPEISVYWSYRYLDDLDLKFLFGYGKSIYNQNNNSTGKTMFAGELLGVYTWSEQNIVLPFFQFGIGIENISDQTSVSKNQGLFIGGCGLKIFHTNSLNLLVSANLKYPFGESYPDYFGKFSDVNLSFRTGMQLDLGSSKVKNNVNEFKNSAVSTTNESAITDSALLERVQLYKVLLHKIILRSEILYELEELISVQNKIIESLGIQLSLARENTENNSSEIKFEDEKINEQIVKNDRENSVLKYSQVETMYKNALNAFNSENYQSCITILTLLKETSPEHPLFTNFIYWIGESHFGLRNYESAVKTFEEVLNYKNSSKLDDATLMSGICYYNLGDYLKAAKVFEYILRKYPNSEYENKSKKYLALLAQKITS